MPPRWSSLHDWFGAVVAANRAIVRLRPKGVRSARAGARCFGLCQAHGRVVDVLPICWLAACYCAMAFLCVSCGEPPPLHPSTATNIIEIIRRAQKTNVRPSYGEYAYQSFTDQDYRAFAEEGQARKIAARLVRDRAFMEAVLALQQMPEEDAQNLLKSSRKPLHATWSQLGRVSAAGQTEAGQRAELDIAEAIVDISVRLSALSHAQIEAIYRGREQPSRSVSPDPAKSPEANPSTDPY